MSAAPQPARTVPVLPEGRRPMAHLLHALNQPLTGLQCSLELAVAAPRRADEYVRTLREALQLSERLRILVEAIRELDEMDVWTAAAMESLAIDSLLRETVSDLSPVAESRKVHVVLELQSSAMVFARRRSLTTLIFRLVEAVISLSQQGSELHISLKPEPDTFSTTVSWRPGEPPEYSPFSRAELGLLIATAGLEAAGIECALTADGSRHMFTVRFPRADQAENLGRGAE